MSNLTIGYGALLTAVGVGGYFATGQQSKTALIPAGFGVAAVGLGALARVDRFRGPALIGAAVLAAGGIGGSIKGLQKLPALLRRDPVERPAAVAAQSAMAVLSAGYLVALGVSTFRR